MIVSCEACQARYKLDDSKVGGKGAKITCPKCKHVFIVRPAAKEETPPPAFPAPAPAPAPSPEVGVPLSEPEPTETRAARGDVSAQAALLDFRKVGVVAWKVKVKIGLIYDFSDIKTLRKYISEGRVTSADVISHDGKNWRQIGEIGDLDTFFLDTYAELERSYTPPAPAAPKAAPVDDALAAATAAAVAADSPAGEAGPRFQDPFANRERPRARGRGPSGEESRRSPLVPALAVGAVVAIAAAWWFTRPEPAPPAPPAPPTAEVPAPPKADVGKELRDKVQGEIEAQLRNGPAVPVTTEPDAHELIPINRAVPSAGTAVPPSGTPMPVPTAKVATSTANDHLAVGDEAALGRDWRTAAAAYGKAAALKPTDSALQLKLGEALLNVGDSGNAQRALLAAANGRQARAWKLLGDLATRDGDAAGANGYYAKYLATNPPDAAAIRSRMGGG